MLSRIRHAASDALTLFLIPGLAAVLPWRAGFAMLRRLARCDWLHREAVEPAWEAARKHLAPADERDWKFHFRLLRLVDHADVYLTLLRARRWRRRYVVETGDWPPAGPCLLLTYHWGAGNWIWPRLRETGFAAHFLARRAQGRALGLTRMSHWFGHFRGWALRRIGSRGALFTGAGSEPLMAAWRDGRCIVGMLDLPARATQTCVRLPLLDGEVRFPFGLVRLALQAEVPIVLASFGLSADSGRRDLHVESLPGGLTADGVMQRYALHLDRRLHEQPAYWQIWREAPAMFADSGDAPVSETK